MTLSQTNQNLSRGLWFDCLVIPTVFNGNVLLGYVQSFEKKRTASARMVRDIWKMYVI